MGAATSRAVASPRLPCVPALRRHNGRVLVFVPMSGLGNSLLAFASFAALANVTGRSLLVLWDRHQNPASAASFSDMFLPPPPNAMEQPFVDGRMLHQTDHTDSSCVRHGQPREMWQLWSRTHGRCRIDATGAKAGEWLRTWASKNLSQAPWAGCEAAWSKGNVYFGPLLQAHGAQPETFGEFSRRLLVPRPHLVRSADRFVEEQRGGRRHSTALIALHVRESHISGRANRTTGEWRHSSTDWASSKQFLSCVAKVGQLARLAGYERERVYIASDQRIVRERAMQLLGNDTISPPHCGDLRCQLPNDVQLGPKRDVDATQLAFQELLVLARSDALLVWKIDSSTYSTVAATWAVQPAAGQALRQRRPWLGIFCVRCGCSRIPDKAVLKPRLPPGLSANDMRTYTATLRLRGLG